MALRIIVNKLCNKNEIKNYYTVLKYCNKLIKEILQGKIIQNEYYSKQKILHLIII